MLVSAMPELRYQSVTEAEGQRKRNKASERGEEEEGRRVIWGGGKTAVRNADAGQSACTFESGRRRKGGRLHGLSRPAFIAAAWHCTVTLDPSLLHATNPPLRTRSFHSSSRVGMYQGEKKAYLPNRRMRIEV